MTLVLASIAAGEAHGAEARSLGFVCKAHDCAGNGFAILFPAGAPRAFGGLVDDGRAPQFFGTPDSAQRPALGAALKQ